MHAKDVYTIIFIVILIMFLHIEFTIHTEKEFDTHKDINRNNETNYNSPNPYRCYACFERIISKIKEDNNFFKFY